MKAPTAVKAANIATKIKFRVLFTNTPPNYDCISYIIKQ
jgi:hypothetical protein